MSNTPKLPYVLNDGYYQYNLQWLVNELLSFKSQLDSAIDLKTIHYADPLHWDITTQYAPNTVVVDPKVGTAYMSKQPVPSGILLTNTDYWVIVFNYQKIYEDIKSGIASNEGDNLNASRDYLPTELLWYGNSLYRAVRAIPEGSVFIPGTNITQATIAGLLEAYYGRDRIAQVLTDTLNVSGTYKLSAVNAILEMDGDLTLTAGDVTVTADNKTETYTGDINVTADNKTETLKGDVKQSGVNKKDSFKEIWIDGQLRYGTTKTVDDNSVLPLLDAKGDPLYLLASNTGSFDVGSTFYHTLDNAIRWYVDGKNGNDTNDGQESTPWKTIDRFFSEVNTGKYGRADIRCYIVSPGTYKTNIQTTVGVSIHITANVDNVIIQPQTTRDYKFYLCHLNLNNLTFDLSNCTEMGLDGGNFAIYNSVFIGAPLNIYSTNGLLNTVTVDTLSVNYSTVSLYKMGVENTDSTKSAFSFTNSFVRFFGAFQNVNSLNSPGTNNSFMRVIASYVVMSSTKPNLANEYYYGLNMSTSTISTTQAYFNALKTRCISKDIAVGDGTNTCLIADSSVPITTSLSCNVRYTSNKLQYFNGTDWLDIPS